MWFFSASGIRMEIHGAILYNRRIPFVIRTCQLNMEDRDELFQMRRP